MSYQQFGPNGFDFGLSAPKTGLGPGVLGDLKTLQALHAQMGEQNCDDCPPDEPCPNCRAAAPGMGSNSGQIIKTQVPIPLPGLFPPPPIGLLPSQPRGPIIVGDPNAWWNRSPGEIADWAWGVVEARPSKEIAAKCEAQLEREKARCEELRQRAEQKAGPQAGYREEQECNKTAMTRYGECRSKNGKTTTQEYPDWYGSD